MLRDLMALVLVCALSCAMALSGCRRDDYLMTHPAAAPSIAPESPGHLYPLRLGNHWTYDVRASVEFHVVGGVPRPPQRFVGIFERELIGVETRFGREYVIEEDKVYDLDHTATLFAWIRFRQDGSGLYQANIPDVVPPLGIRADDGSGAALRQAGTRPYSSLGRSLVLAAPPRLRRVLVAAWSELEQKRLLMEPAMHAAPGIGTGSPSADPPDGTESGELRRLAYPLKEGRRWSVRSGPFTVDATVEARETLQLPAGNLSGFRVRYDNSLLDPEDRFVVWFGRCGRLRFFSHLEQVAIDALTGEVVRIVMEETHELSRAVLASRHSCEHDPN